jgi:hypothetical protein
MAGTQQGSGAANCCIPPARTFGFQQLFKKVISNTDETET